MTDLVFQVIDWYVRDIELDFDEDNESDDSNNTPKKYLIKMFGMDSQGKTYSVNITDFTPYMYIKLPRKVSDRDVRNIYEALKRYHKFMHDIRVVRGQDLRGFTNAEKFWFLRIRFQNHDGLRKVERFFSNPVYVSGFGKHKFQLYESNIEPYLRFIHKRNIRPCGWVRIPAGKYWTDEDTLVSTNTVNVSAKWTSIEGFEDSSTAPFVIASFDLECTSSHGDFPVPKKDYTKSARELVEMHRLFQEIHKVPAKLCDALAEELIYMFDTSRTENTEHGRLSKVFPKKAVSVETIRNLIQDHKYEFMRVLRGDVEFVDEDAAEGGLLSVSYEDDEPEEAEEQNAFECMRSGSKKTRSAPSTDKTIVYLTRLMDKLFPRLEGDPVIQIGVVHQRFGSLDFEKTIFVLGECAPVDGVTVVSCPTERELLLEFTSLIQRVNPDIMTGYNIFGFDMVYLVERARELNCLEEFMLLGRLQDVPCDFVIKNLSSSALGDNTMKVIQMDGRVSIDLMKVVQRDHKLDSYKLDNVVNTFMKGSVLGLSSGEDGTTVLKLQTTQGIVDGNFVKLSNGNKYKVLKVDTAESTVTIAESLDLTLTKLTWSLAKDDITPKQIFDCHLGTPEDRALIAKYCIQDCVLCNMLMSKLSILPNNFGMANVCWVPLSYIFMRGQSVKIFSLVAKQCLEDGIMVPTIRPARNPDGSSVEETDSYEGAIVLDPVPGIYTDPVSVLDYASLYPSSMISENISHDSIVLDPKYDNLPGMEYVDISFDLYDGVGDKKKKIGVQTCRFAQLPEGKKSVMPRILMTLLAQRKATRLQIEEKAVTLETGEVVYGLVSKKDDGTVEVKALPSKTVSTYSNVVSISDRYDDFAKAVYDGLQLAYKVTANSLYGQLGAPTSPIYMKECAACTTATGRKMILMAKDFLEENYLAKVVYGDSVASYTPVYVRVRGQFDICTISDLATRYGSDHWIPCVEPGKQEKEACELEGVETWSDQGWTPLHRVIRHALAPHKKMVRVRTLRGLVDVTDDHSLLSSDEGKPVTPKDVVVGTRLLHHKLPTDILPRKIPNFDRDDESQLAQAWWAWFEECKPEDTPVIGDEVVSLDYLPYYTGYVYDLTTDNHHFAAGVGNLIVHNTDSIFAIFPKHDIQNGNVTVKLMGQEALEHSIRTASDASDRFKPLLKSPHDLEYEKTFFPFIIFSKKRYVGNLYEHDPTKFYQKSMGIALKRRDYANIVKEVYGGIIKIILNERNVQKSLDFFHKCIGDIVNGKYPMENFVITKTLKGSYKNPTQIAHKVLVDRMRKRDPGSAPQVNDRIPFVYIVTKPPPRGTKVLQGDKIEHPVFIEENKLEIDYGFYITNQIMNPVVQLYALVLDQIKGYRKPAGYYEQMEQSFITKDNLTPKKAREKVQRLKEKEVEELLFKPYLLKLENKVNRQSTLDLFIKK
jgi:DNA polymerase elongation subunit (family B)